MGVANLVFSAFRRLGLVILITIAFFFGLATTVYLSLRSPEVTVPEVVGKDRFEAEQILGKADLNFRVRATRPSNQVQANTVLFQVPRAGEVVKTGQTVAMDISRAAKEGETSETVVNDKKAGDEKAAENRNTNTPETTKNTNENRPKRTVNANANENSNTNANRARSTNSANANSRPSAANSNASPSRTVNQNDNSPSRAVNQNDNRRPPAPKPAPTSQNDNRKKR
ncbi:MAG: PASTA domain-containing protein [Pyrinomonadaceae bacterium]|nr:PASTA domain-containing protein [Pyrinomonadaceae bacterium]